MSQSFEILIPASEIVALVGRELSAPFTAERRDYTLELLRLLGRHGYPIPSPLLKAIKNSDNGLAKKCLDKTVEVLIEARSFKGELPLDQQVEIQARPTPSGATLVRVKESIADIELLSPAAIKEYWDVFGAWDNVDSYHLQAKLTKEFLSIQFCPEPRKWIWQWHAEPETEQQHIENIQWFYQKQQGWDLPIEVDCGIPGTTARFCVTDGNHRLAAALLRGDWEIKARCSGDVDLIVSLRSTAAPTVYPPADCPLLLAMEKKPVYSPEE